MTPLIGVYLFLLGFAGGLALLAAASFRHVSPRWLRWLLTAAVLSVVSRYLAMVLFAAAQSPQQFWALRHCWFASSVGLTLPGVFAIDQLLRHPAWSPRILLGWFSPFLLAYAAVILFGTSTPLPDRIAGWTLTLDPGWQLFLSSVQAVFVIGYIGMSLLLMRKVPSRPIRLALLGLVAAYTYLGIDGLVLALGGWYFRPYLFSEMFALVAIWHAYETSTSAQS